MEKDQMKERCLDGNEPLM